MIVILSWNNLAKTYVLGDKNDTISAMKYLLTRKTQRSDNMKDMLFIITINSDEEALTSKILMTREIYLYRICDVSLP